jgi:hypothetical protein
VAANDPAFLRFLAKVKKKMMMNDDNDDDDSHMSRVPTDCRNNMKKYEN